MQGKYCVRASVLFITGYAGKAVVGHDHLHDAISRLSPELEQQSFQTRGPRGPLLEASPSPAWVSFSSSYMRLLRVRQVLLQQQN
jgi:hypothetical protein